MATVKVHIVTDVSDLSGVHHAGEEPEVDAQRAQQYLASGLATEVTGEPGPKPAP